MLYFNAPFRYPRKLLSSNQRCFRFWVRAERQPSIGYAALSLCSSALISPIVPDGIAIGSTKLFWLHGVRSATYQQYGCRRILRRPGDLWWQKPLKALFFQLYRKWSCMLFHIHCRKVFWYETSYQSGVLDHRSATEGTKSCKESAFPAVGLV